MRMVMVASTYGSMEDGIERKIDGGVCIYVLSGLNYDIDNL